MGAGLSPATLAAGALVANAFVWGTSWWPFRQVASLGLHPLWATVAIYGLVVVLVLAIRPGAFLHLARSPGLWVLVLASGTTNAAFNWGVVIGDVVRVVLLFYLMPLWAVLLARWLLGEPLTRAAAGRVALALAGALVVLWPGSSAGPWGPSLADALGVIGGFSFALNNVMLRHQAHHPGDARAVAMFLGGALVAGVLAMALTAAGQLVAPPWPGALLSAWVAGLAVVFLIGNLALQYGATRLPANVTAVIMLVEVVFASVSALALGGGALTVPVALGGSMIVAAALWAAAERPPSTAGTARGAAGAAPGAPAATIAGPPTAGRAADRPSP